MKGAALECVEYVMANTAPSHVTGNTHFGRFLNEDRNNEFCDSCIKYLEKKLDVPAHGILLFDMIENHVNCSDFYDVGEVVHIDLVTPEEIWNNLSSKNRNVIPQGYQEWSKDL